MIMIIIYNFRGGDVMLNQSRHSRQREAILALLKSTKLHPTADWLFSELKKEFPNIGLATIYRNLKLFEEQGLLIRIDVGDGFEHYDADTSDHYHFFCSDCRRVIDLDMPPLQFDDVLPDGFSSEHHQLVFFGKCNNCKTELCS